MRKLNTLAADLKARVVECGKFQTVLVSGATSYDQFVQDLPNIAKLPAVVIVIGSGISDNRQLTREIRFGLALVDRVQRASSAGTMGIFELAEELAGLFPAEGVAIEDVWYLPGDFNAMELPGNHTAYLFEVKALQGAETT